MTRFADICVEPKTRSEETYTASNYRGSDLTSSATTATFSDFKQFDCSIG